MELTAYIYDAKTKQPVPYATLQVLYPDGQNYASPKIADANGKVDGRCPDTSYKWLISSVGYSDRIIELTGAKDSNTVNVGLEQNAELLDAVVVTPKKKALIGVGLAIAAVLIAKHYKYI